ncbi:NmrA-like family domain-containing protein 1 like [Verticillium longisporum]|uniref:NmrA-like family domain-containing protein 1 like n=1 Tax=Verticillium longisporum TaxID=100787 RepID=A0A8I2ZFH2_VERLO|nr:NmrA-like family domain-containing protein 1 like [Verticillium longisporum]
MILTSPPHTSLHHHNGSISSHLWATGKQGGAVINVADNADLDILAVTRNPSSASAQRLANKSSRIKLVEGDLADPSLVLKTAHDISGAPVLGVFSVQFFVYTSVDRHGDRSGTNPTDVPHFIHKHEIEKHLMARAEGTRMAWTILRPVAFMENLTDDFFGRVFPTAWRKGAAGKRLQLVAVSDIGVFAAKAFSAPEAWAGRAVSLAGANPTLDEFAAIFKRSTGRQLPYANGILVSIIMWLMKDFGSMFRWFAEEGYDADIEALRKIPPGLKDVRAWLETESDFTKAE